MDFRLWSRVFSWMREQEYLGDCDIVAVAGASKGIADGDEVGNVLLKQIDSSVSLHKTQRVILLHHSDCGAYAKSYQFESAAEEKEKQIEDMNKSVKIIKEKFPEVQIELVWGELMDENGEDIEFSEIK